MKVMLLYANAGNGHRRAAEALTAICEQDPRVTEFRLIDALDHTNKVFQELYANLYIETVKKAPALWSMAFDNSDRPWVREKGRMLVHRMHGQSLAREVRKFQPDLCLCTHFMPSDIISTMLREDRIQTDLGVVVTDYYVHAAWLESYVTRVYVAKEESRQQLLKLSFPAARVSALGIPIDPLFEQPGDRDLLSSKHGVDPARPTVLLSAGAFGVMAPDEMAGMLGGISAACNLVVVCGRNEKLKEQIERYVATHGSERVSYHILGFTDEMHEWMSIASLFVGKPGGLSTAECLARGLPMVIWNPIPGQEVFNAAYLLENGVAISPDCVATLPFRIDGLLNDSAKLEGMRQAARRLGRPDAARAIVDDAIEHHGEGLVRIPKAGKRSADRRG